MKRLAGELKHFAQLTDWTTLTLTINTLFFNTAF